MGSSPLFFDPRERRVHRISACLWFGREALPAPQVGDSCLGYLAGLWRLGSHDCFLSPQLYLVSISSVLHEDPEEDSRGWVLTLKQWETCSSSWFDLCLAKMSCFSFQPGSSNTTQEILMPVTSTTLLGVWQLRDWYENSLFLSFTPTFYSIHKDCDFRGEIGEVSIKRKKNASLRLTGEKSPDLPCEWLPWPQVCSEQRWQWWVWKKSPNQEKRHVVRWAQCDRSWGRGGHGQEGVMRGLFNFPN